jgi:hypothetical protein
MPIGCTFQAPPTERRLITIFSKISAASAGHTNTRNSGRGIDFADVPSLTSARRLDWQLFYRWRVGKRSNTLLEARYKCSGIELVLVYADTITR